MPTTRRIVFGTGSSRRPFDGWDLLAIVLVVGVLAFFGEFSGNLLAPLTSVERSAVPLDPALLPQYAARTTLRMLVALLFSLLFTFTYAPLAAKSRRAGQLLIPMLDILQSVPILGFVSVTVVFLIHLAPDRVLGAELAAVFAIFTSQAWNMTFSFYQSLRTVPQELTEAADSFRLSAWMRFWRLEVPFAMPALIWNMMMSMSGSWFFVVAAEAIHVGPTELALPGIGSFIATAIAQRDLAAIGWAIGTMALVILLYDQLLFRPLVAWADRFRVDQDPRSVQPRSWVLSVWRRSRLLLAVRRALGELLSSLTQMRLHFVPARPVRRLRRERPVAADAVWYITLGVLLAAALWQISHFLLGTLTVADVLRAVELGAFTMTRVFILISLASLLWVPIGVFVGLRPALAGLVQPIAQFLAAFPANLLFPLVVSVIVQRAMNPEIWLSPLMLLGTQWYLLFNVIAGAGAIPSEMQLAAANFHVRGWLWWRQVALPAISPYYVTGAITASGGAWNASIVAEVVNWGSQRLEASGLGAYIAIATEQADFHRVVLGITVMSIYVVVINHLLWRPLYRRVAQRYRLA
jgi:NitT/TauT family transport system permease protein